MTPFTDAANLQTLLDVEVALAVAEAEAGVIPSSCVGDIRAAARAERYDLAALHDEAGRAGNIVIPLVRRLTEIVAASNAEAARYVHYGATSQDIDTALVLRLRASLPAIEEALTRAIGAAALLARQHATTPIIGRTLLQQASPTTFGLKAAGWLDMMARCRQRLGASLAETSVVQLGGAAGTLAAMGAAGPAVGDAFARALSLSAPAVPWHTQRDRLANLSAMLGITCGALGKIGRDLTLLGQTEVGEAYETPAAGRGGSSSMPHKQNPIRAITAVAVATRAPALVATMLAAVPQEHERAAGGWQAEWETLPELVRLTMQSAGAIGDALGNLTVDTERMRHNLALRGGVAMTEALVSAMSAHIPRSDAMRIVERVSRAAERGATSLRAAAAADGDIGRWLSRDDIDRALHPENCYASATTLIERVLREWGV